MLTDDQLRQLIEELPEREPRSRLDKFQELLVEMRSRQYSYRQIARFLGERCAVPISHNAIRNFLNQRNSKGQVPARPVALDLRQSQKTSTASTEPLLPETNQSPEAVRDRIDALKRRSEPSAETGSNFRFDPAQPLILPDK